MHDPVDVCCQVSEEPVTNDSIDTTMFGTTSLLSFSKFFEHVLIDAVVKLVYKYKESKASHIVVVRFNIFQLCSCLQALRCGLPCRYIIAALVETRREVQRGAHPPPVAIFARAVADRVGRTK